MSADIIVLADYRRARAARMPARLPEMAAGEFFLIAGFVVASVAIAWLSAFDRPRKKPTVILRKDWP